MKLLIISLCTSGVMRNHFINTAKELSTYFSLYCVTNDNVSNEELGAVETCNIRYKRSEPLSYFSPVKLSKIKKFIKRINPDCVFIFTPHPINILFHRFIKKYNVSYLIHDPVPHSGTGFLDRIVLRKQHLLYLKSAKSLVLAGSVLKEQLLGSYKVSLDKIHIIPFGIPDDILFEEYKYSHSGDVDILFFGRVEYYKGLDVLFEALLKLNPSISCIVAGKGDIESIYKNISIPPNVCRIDSFLSDEELARLISESKVVVLPYRDATGTFTVGQAYFYGKPVIASDVGVMKEYVGSGGLIVRPNDSEQLKSAIEKLLSDNQLYENLSKEAYNIYENCFSFKEYCSKIAEMLKQTVSN